ncbi:MAG: c-type cytochrome [Hyphomicrobiaceae bacterium]
MRDVHSLVILVALTGFTVVANHSARAGGDANRGGQIAAKWCVACHVIGPGAKRPSENQPASFQEIADTPGFGAFALNVFFRTPHKEMPNFTITGDLRDDLVAYITSLKRK